MKKRSKLRTILFAMISIAVSLLFSLGVLELVVSKFLSSDMVNVSTRFDPLIGWRYTPGTYKVKRQNSLFTHQIHVNALGLRTGRLPPFSGGNATRIIVLGDSFSFAKAVRYDKIYTSELERRLNAERERQYVVVNAGVEGFGTAQQLLMMKDLADNNVTGEIYVLQIFTNDILDNLRLKYSSKEIDTRQPGYVLTDDNELVLAHMPREKERTQLGSGSENRRGNSFKVVQVLQNIIETQVQTMPAMVDTARKMGIRPSVPRMPGIVNGWYDDDVLERGVPLMTELIREIKSEAAKRNAELLIMFVPSPLMIYPRTYGPLLRDTFKGNGMVEEFLDDTAKSQKIVKAICDELGLHLLDLYPILLENNDKALFFPREGHFTSTGHMLVAESLSQVLKDRFLH